MTSLVATVERVEQRAKEVHVGRLLLSLIAVIPFVVGYTVFWAVKLVRLVVVWVWSAAVVGWEMAAEPRAERAP